MIMQDLGRRSYDIEDGLLILWNPTSCLYLLECAPLPVK